MVVKSFIGLAPLESFPFPKRKYALNQFMLGGQVSMLLNFFVRNLRIFVLS
jgi:hypothetical protein